MAEDSKKAFDPDATVAQPAAAADPDATIAQPIPALDPDATVTQPLSALDPEATVTGPMAQMEPDAEATDRRPAFDPDATDRRPAFDPEGTVRIPSPGKLRNNPFAPKSTPESLQANLSSLGGLNSLVAMANPVLAAVPQIRRTLKHPDPAGLLNGLRDQIESLEMSAVSGEIPDDTVSAAVYALCALLDESAAATPWGRAWAQQGLLNAFRGESNGAEGFFELLEKTAADPEGHADLLEFLYICLALGFEGRYRQDRAGLDALKDRIYGLIARRRPRPDMLSERWRTPAAQAAADAALQTAARANAARAAADAAARAAEAPAAPAGAPPRFDLSRLPRRAIWSGVAGIVGASIVFYMLALRLLDDETRHVTSSSARMKSAASAKGGTASAQPDSTAAAVSSALAGLPVTVRNDAGRAVITLALDRQFGPGSPQPSADTRALLAKIAGALDKLPGAIVVAGHADASPAGTHYASNQELSAARARAAAKAMVPALADPKRLAAEGRGDAEPLAPNDSDANRAKNRRVSIVLSPAP